MGGGVGTEMIFPKRFLGGAAVGFLASSKIVSMLGGEGGVGVEMCRDDRF